MLSYFNLRKNLINDELVKTNKEAITILNKQLNVDIFKLCSNDKILVSELIYDERLKDFKLDSLLINKLSLMINKIIPNIKYNPFFLFMEKNKLKILLTISNFESSGSGKVLYDLAKHLDKSKFEVEIACKNSKGNFLMKLSL
ncbi:hypothetical protein H9X57_06645 [Flavobacterium piscinae]|uniref:hypothetical protein n=1 Tax=Flavobacterium piscinae TaxID=2506424 RepID=UPI00199FE6B3|nr:hypothetical protein [Flavobacterium piscinae]MBC8883201.1 hypothetical protein [Flavobacterium piscinae]